MPDEKLPIPQFAAKIKAKYPEYKDVNDTLLVQKIVAKYPEYRESVDLSGIEEPSKKKVSPLLSGVTSQAGSGLLNGGGGGVKKVEYPDTLPENEWDRKRAEREKYFSDTINQEELQKDPLKTLNKAIFSEAIGKEINKRPVSESTGQKYLSPEIKVNEENINVHNQARLQDNLKANIFPTTQSARERLFSEGRNGVADPNNETDLLAENVIREHEKVKAILNLHRGDIKNAAIEYYANQDPRVAEIFKAGGTPPPETVGALVGNFLRDKNVLELSQESEEFNNAYREAQFNFRKDYPEMFTNEIVQKIAQGREDYGENNPFINLVGVNSSDRVMQKLYADGKVDDEEMEHYEKTVRPQLALHLKRIQTTGFAENAFQSAEKGAADIPKGLYDLTGIHNAITTKADRAYDELSEEANYTHVTPKTFGGTIATATGHLGGLLLPLSAGTKALAASKIMNAKTANEVMMGLTFYHDLYKDAEKNNPNGGYLNQLQALVQTTIFAKINPTFGALSKGVVTKAAPQIKEVLEKLKTGSITGSQAKEGIVQAILTQVPKKTLKTSGEMMLATGVSDAVGGIFSGKYDGEQSVSNMVHTFESMLLGTPLLNLASVRSNRRVMEEYLNDMGSNPTRYREQITKLAETDPEIKKRLPELLQNLTHVEAVKKELDAREDIKPSEKKKYLLLSLQEKLLKEKADAIPDEGLKPEKQLKEIEIEKKMALDPDMGSKKFLEEMYEYELIPESDRVLLENNETGKFEPNKVGEYLKYIAQQANGLTEDWKPAKGGKPTMEKYPPTLLEAANERWAKEIEKALPKEEPISDLGFDPETSQPTSEAKAESPVSGVEGGDVVVDEKIIKSRVKRIAKSLNVDEQRSQQIHDIALKAKDYEDFKKQVGDLIGDDTVNENRIADAYNDVRDEAKSEYQKKLERSLEDLRERYKQKTSTERGLKDIEEKSPSSIRKFIRRLLHGTTPEDVEAAKAKLADQIKQHRQEKAALRSQLPRERGVNFVTEKLSRAARNGDISQEAADLAIDLLRKRPDLFEDLAISITKKTGENDGVQGWYRAADALVKVFKNPSDPTTAVHEVLHHTERFLPQDVRDRIIKEWNNEVELQIKDIKKKLETETNVDKRQQLTNGLIYLGLAQERQVEPNQSNVKDMETIMSKYLGDHVDSQGNFHKGLGQSWYQLYNPSEWWAVNASRLFREAKNKPELKTWVDKAKAFYDYIIESVKKIFKGSPTAAVEKGLKAILNGETLEDRTGNQLSTSKKLLNIKQKGSFEDKLKSIYDEVNKSKSQPKEQSTKVEEQGGGLDAGKSEIATQNIENQPPEPPKKPPVDAEGGSGGDGGNLSGIKKGLVSDEIIKGVDLERVGDRQMIELGRKIIDSGEVKPEALVQKIITEKTGVLKPSEVVALITYKADIDNGLRDAYKKANEKTAAGEDLGTLGVEIKDLERQQHDFDVMAVITANQQSMAFRLRRMMLDRDYNVVVQIEKYKKNNNGHIPEEIEVKFRELDKELKEVKEKLAEAEKKAADREGQEAVDNIKESVQRENKYTEEELEKKVQEGVESEISKLYEQLPSEKRGAADKAIAALEKFRKKLKGDGSKAYSSLAAIPVAIADTGALVAIRAIKVGKSVVEAVRIGINRMKEDLKKKGIDVKGWEEQYTKDLTEALEAEGVSLKPVKDKPTINDDGSIHIPNEMLRELVGKGIDGIWGLTDAVHKEVVKELPNITKQQVMERITEYGKKVNPTSDKIQQQINTAKRIGRILAEIESLRRPRAKELTTKEKNKISELERHFKRQLRSIQKDILGKEEITDAESLSRAKERVKTSIDDLQRKLRNKDFAKPKKKPPITDTELQGLQHKKELLQEEFDKEQYKVELKNRKWWQKGEDFLKELFTGVSRALVAGFDFSAGFVQGTWRIFTNPKMSVKAFGEMFRQFASEKRNNEWFTKLKASGVYEKIKQSKLAVTDEQGKSSVKEGLFITNWTNKIYDAVAWLVTGGYKPATKFVRGLNPLKASQRAFDGYVNYIRVAKFLEVAKRAEDKGGYTIESDPQVFEKLADHVNTTTGRGSMGKLETSSNWLSILLFAPRKVISEVKLFTPYAFLYYAKMPKYVRHRAMLDFAKFLTSYVSVNASIWAASNLLKDDDDETKWDDNFWNMNSSDFMTHKFGNTRLQLGGQGAKSALVAQSRMWSGLFTDQYGKTTKLGERSGKEVNTTFDVGLNYLINKASPGLGALIKKAREKKGREVDDAELVKDLTVPMWLRDAEELYKDHPMVIGSLFNILSIFGGSVRTVDESKSSSGFNLTPEEKKDPTFKYFIDKGINFPELDPKKIGTKERNGKVTEHLSDLPKETQEKYIETKKRYLKEELDKLQNGEYEVYRDKNGTVRFTDDGNSEYVEFKDLTKEDINYLLGSSLSGKITEKTKKEVLGEQ